MGTRADTGRDDERAGSRALALLSVPLSSRILDQLVDGPLRLAVLCGESGSAPASTVRLRLKRMQHDGLAVRRPLSRGSSDVANFELTAAGVDLLTVAAALQHWLALAPPDGLAFDSATGVAAIKALNGGWSSTILASLASEPLSQSELSVNIDAIAYPSLGRRLTALRRAGQVQACARRRGAGTAYEVTEWLRQGVAPLAAAVLWERTHFAADTATMTRMDIEASFLLTLPLLRMGRGPGGSCRMGVEIDDAQGRLCGAVAVVKRGGRVSGSAGAVGPADSWADGSVASWAEAMLGDGTGPLKVGGERKLALGVLAGLHGALFS